MEKILPKKSFPAWLRKLQAYEIYAPMLIDDHWSFELVKNPEEVNLDFPNSLQSPKKTILPQREVFLEFSKSGGNNPEVREVLPEERQTVIFGVRPCDARALLLQDKVFGGEFADFYYWRRRNPALIIGLACNTPPSLHCFCTSVDGSPHSAEGMEILMIDLKERYYLETRTERGNKLLSLGKALFQQPGPKDKKEVARVKKESEKKIRRQIKDLGKIPPKLKGMFESPLWDEESLSCIQCGICTYLCPTCHCFDIQDELTASSPATGIRVRTWDTCQFPDFTMHSSGHNPRPDRASRLRQRIMHKFNYFVEIHKTYQCTGCGRCISKCPVSIDIIEVLEKVKAYGA